MQTKLCDLVVYRSLLQEHLLDAHIQAKNSAHIYASLLQETEERCLSGNLWQVYCLDLLLTADNLFSRKAGKTAFAALDKQLLAVVASELQIVKDMVLAGLPQENQPLAFWLEHYENEEKWGSPLFYAWRARMAADFWQLNPAEMTQRLAAAYAALGWGKGARFASFRWENGLRGIKYSDPVTLDELIGYEAQKAVIMKNTEALLGQNRPNNLLLYGERGTGKSSMVKAVGNDYAQKGLKIVELPSYQLIQFSALLQALIETNGHYIIFIDDLSFESGEKDYKYLKGLLEGSLSALPERIAIYATSNRRHLMNETWTEREGQDPIHLGDYMAERLSLSDRFGITLTFPPLDQEEYLHIVRGIAQKEGIALPARELEKQALQWVLWQNSRSGRTARQFINHLLVDKK